MPRRKKSADETPRLLDITSKLRFSPCVPPLREAVKSWKASGCKGITDTTRTLLSFWLQADHKLKTGRPFRYHESQQEAIETLIYVWEVEQIRTRKDLLERYAQNIHDLRLPPDDYRGFRISIPRTSRSSCHSEQSEESALPSPSPAPPL